MNKKKEQDPIEECYYCGGKAVVITSDGMGPLEGGGICSHGVPLCEECSQLDQTRFEWRH